MTDEMDGFPAARSGPSTASGGPGCCADRNFGDITSQRKSVPFNLTGCRRSQRLAGRLSTIPKSTILILLSDSPIRCNIKPDLAGTTPRQSQGSWRTKPAGRSGTVGQLNGMQHGIHSELAVHAWHTTCTHLAGVPAVSPGASSDRGGCGSG
jgi:hypothetical protein